MQMSPEKRQARIAELNAQLKNECDPLEGREMVLAMHEMYVLVCEDLQEKQIELRKDIVDIRYHRKSAINAQCNDELIERANKFLWQKMAADLKLDAEIKTFKGFIAELQIELRD